MSVIRQLYSPKIAAEPDMERLFQDYYDRLVFFAWQIVKDKPQAEDIAQDAFIAYWQQSGNVASHPAAIKNFLYRCVKNAGLDVVRHMKVIDQFQAGQPNFEPCEAYIEEAIISAEIIAGVNAAIESLPDYLKKLSRLSFLEGKKNQEVADELGISVNTVKKQKQRALELLKTNLTPPIIILAMSCGACFIQK